MNVEGWRNSEKSKMNAARHRERITVTEDQAQRSKAYFSKVMCNNLGGKTNNIFLWTTGERVQTVGIYTLVLVIRRKGAGLIVLESHKSYL